MAELHRPTRPAAFERDGDDERADRERELERRADDGGPVNLAEARIEGLGVAPGVTADGKHVAVLQVGFEGHGTLAVPLPPEAARRVAQLLIHHAELAAEADARPALATPSTSDVAHINGHRGPGR